MIHKYCNNINRILSDTRYTNHSIYHYTSFNPVKRANSAFLMGAYQILVLGRSAEEAWEPFRGVPKFQDFIDASSEPSGFELTIFDCLKGLQKARALNWFDLESFDAEAYERYSEPKYGGFNWIVPHKFLAFINPISKPTETGLTPEEYVEIFSSMGITAVIRLNTATYGAMKFTKNGIQHYNLYFHDGSVPSNTIIDEFLEISEKEGPIAIHCQAGLGRTATLIGCYVIKKYNFTGQEFIGWARICRAGSVLGPQQNFLCEYNQSQTAVARNPVISPFERFKSKFGEMGQGARLVSNSRNGIIQRNTELISKKNTSKGIL
jgi:cell division cycle 14